MIFANKKTSTSLNTAQQNAQILKVVKQLLEKNVIRIEGQTVWLYPQIWKDKVSTENWIKCLYIYCQLKKHINNKALLTFKNIENQELLATIQGHKVKIHIDSLL